MSETGEPRPPERPEAAEPSRVYPPHEVQVRLEVSASGLRRLAGIYERTVGPLPRDERGRVWPEGAVEALEDARALVRESRAVSIEAALRGQELGHDAKTYPATQRPVRGDTDPGAALMGELKAMRETLEDQNRLLRDQAARLERLEETAALSPTGRPELPQGMSIPSEDPPRPWLLRRLPDWVGSAAIAMFLTGLFATAGTVTATFLALNGLERYSVITAAATVVMFGVFSYLFAQHMRLSSEARGSLNRVRATIKRAGETIQDLKAENDELKARLGEGPVEHLPGSPRSAEPSPADTTPERLDETEAGKDQDATERGVLRRVAAWFGFGVRRS